MIQVVFNFSTPLAPSHYSILILLGLSTLAVYSIIYAGWASMSKYAYLGALRSSAQMISYEVSFSLIIMPVLLCTGALMWPIIHSLQFQTNDFFIAMHCSILLFIISTLAETNRAPFDLAEAEAELVAGYNVEYPAAPFAIFFLAEYGNMLTMSALVFLLFLNVYDCYYIVPSIVLIAFCFILVRASFPRYRYDQLMNIGWKYFLPLSLSNLIVIVFAFACFNNYILIG